MLMKKITVIVIALTFLVLAVLPLEKARDGGPKDKLTKVTFRMNWKLTAPHAVYLLGKDLGFYEEEGIDLEILEGNGSVTTGQLIANKSDTFGLADSAALIPIMAKGLPMMGTKTGPADIKRISSRRFRIILKEGKNRQIRRMVRKVGNQVATLKRVRVANIKLGRLAEKNWRHLNPQEKKDLLKIL